MMDDWFLKALLLHVPLLWIGGGKFQSTFNNGQKFCITSSEILVLHYVLSYEL